MNGVGIRLSFGECNPRRREPARRCQELEEEGGRERGEEMVEEGKKGGMGMSMASALFIYSGVG